MSSGLRSTTEDMPAGSPTAAPVAPVDRSTAWLQGADLRVLAKLPLSALLAWCVPVRHWDGVADAAAGLQAGTRARLTRRIAAILGPATPRGRVEAIAHQHLALLRVDQLAFLRSHGPGGWDARTSLAGAEHLEAALAAGRGAIIWMTPTVFGPLAGKRALCEAGHRPHHLSHPGHGFSSVSRVARRLINPIRTRVEDRYLAERVMLGEGGQAHTALRRLGELLRRNAVVSITVGGRGTRVTRATFLHGSLLVASGAPHLAARTGAALLPATTWRTADGGFVTRIGAPLRTAGAEAALAMADGFAAFASGHPEQVHWEHNGIDPTPPGAASP
jgi:lauroyl/myristoyl acyltransferase